MEKQRLRGTNTLFTEEVFVLHVTATHLVRKMSGGSHSILMMCDDGNLYVVKLAENPQGPNLLANERLGTQLAGALGLKIPVMAFVSVPSLLIDNAPKEWFESYAGGRPRGGLHCGSRFVGSPPQNYHVFDLIGRSDFQAVANRSDFLGILILDIWANHQDSRQAVFHRQSLGAPLQATLIDYGGMFGGPSCIFDDEKCNALYFDSSIYRELWSKALVDGWKTLIRERTPDILNKVDVDMPSAWYNQAHQAARLMLLDRLESLDSLIETYSDRLRL